MNYSPDYYVFVMEFINTYLQLPRTMRSCRRASAYLSYHQTRQTRSEMQGKKI